MPDRPSPYHVRYIFTLTDGVLIKLGTNIFHHQPMCSMPNFKSKVNIWPPCAMLGTEYLSFKRLLLILCCSVPFNHLNGKCVLQRSQIATHVRTQVSLACTEAGDLRVSSESLLSKGLISNMSYLSHRDNTLTWSFQFVHIVLPNLLFLEHPNRVQLYYTFTIHSRIFFGSCISFGKGVLHNQKVFYEQYTSITLLKQHNHCRCMYLRYLTFLLSCIIKSFSDTNE